MTERRKRRRASDVLREEVKELEERLARLEQLLETVRSEATRRSGAARARLEHMEKLVTTRIGTTQTALKSALDRVSRVLTESRKSVEREIGLLNRALRAGVKAGKDAYRGKPGD